MRCDLSSISRTLTVSRSHLTKPNTQIGKHSEHSNRQTPSGSASPSSSPSLALASHHHLDLPFPPTLAVSRSPQSPPQHCPCRLTASRVPSARHPLPPALALASRHCAASPIVRPHHLTSSPAHRLTRQCGQRVALSSSRARLCRQPSPVHHNSASSGVGDCLELHSPQQRNSQPVGRRRRSPATAVTLASPPQLCLLISLLPM
ncbi:hypothetical protein Syun_031821 [Stephania yunnanensis]|uniref:Uncharacterized protein n=1 Tax=Stephania yunnanensis TaxID=152371 RepID=A0AAP0HH41_9MAGN